MTSISKTTKFAVLLLVMIPTILVYSPNLSSKNIVPLPGKGFYLQTGLIDLHDGADVKIPWLGFSLHVLKVNTSHGMGYALVRMDGPGGTVAYMNISRGFVFNGSQYGSTGSLYVIITGDVRIKVGDHRGVPYFRVVDSSNNWIKLPDRILANITSANFTANATTDEIASSYPYFIARTGAAARLNSTTYPVRAWGVWNVSGDSRGYAYIWSPEIFPWFNGSVISYFLPGYDQIYVFGSFEKAAEAVELPCTSILNSPYFTVFSAVDANSVRTYFQSPAFSPTGNVIVGGPFANYLSANAASSSGVSFTKDKMIVNGSVYESKWQKTDHAIILLKNGRIYVMGTHRYGTKAALLLLSEKPVFNSYIIIKWEDLNGNADVERNEITLIAKA
jgi:hypothetical protein